MTKDYMNKDKDGQPKKKFKKKKKIVWLRAVLVSLESDSAQC